MPEAAPFSSPVSFADLFMGRMQILSALVARGEADDLLFEHSNINAATARVMLAGCDDDIDWMRTFYERYSNFHAQTQEGENVAKRCDNFIAAIRRQMLQSRNPGLSPEHRNAPAPTPAKGAGLQQGSLHL